MKKTDIIVEEILAKTTAKLKATLLVKNINGTKI